MSDFFSAMPLAQDTARRMLAQLRSVPALAERYADVLALDSLGDLVHVPVMRKDDMNVALEHLRPRALQGATWTFQSGGSTGMPKLGYAPTGLYMDEVFEQWKALGPDDVFVNGWGAGKLWGAHYLMAAYADLAGCTGLGLGSITKGEYDFWLELFADRRVTAIGGTPSVLRPIFAHARAVGLKLPDLRAVLWLGEGWNPGLDDDLPAVAPNARRWGLYGSTETWVVGTNTPQCAVDVWHPLPSQLVHVGPDQLIDVTSLKPHGLNPALRYQTGDAGEWVRCTCGVPSRALRVLGRRNGEVKFRGVHFVNVDALIGTITGQPGVAQVQLVITEYADRPSLMEVLIVPRRDAAPDLAGRVREHILGTEIGGPNTMFHRDPDALVVRLVDALVHNERTGKVPDLVERYEP
ncbi:AMP-binding protein [Micromonospora sp. NPDC048830]|uniref:AMP-binding protein n=1 Tax=Micromonospora sp. NPDC048830 TaxID=3364257 RepID=UPI003710789B